MCTDLAWSPSCWQSAHLDEKSATRRSDPPSRYTDASWDCARVTGTVLQQPERKTTTTAVHTHTGESVHNTAPSNDSRVRSSSSEKLLNAQRRLRAQQLAQLTRTLAQLLEHQPERALIRNNKQRHHGCPHHIAIAAASGSTARSFSQIEDLDKG